MTITHHALYSKLDIFFISSVNINKDGRYLQYQLNTNIAARRQHSNNFVQNIFNRTNLDRGDTKIKIGMRTNKITVDTPTQPHPTRHKFAITHTHTYLQRHTLRKRMV